MSLVIGYHLQAVLDGAKKMIGGLQVGAGIGADPAAFGERCQHRQRFAAAQFGMPSAGNELLGLHEKLDLADAAAAELDVVAFDRDVLVAPIGVDLALERFDVGHRGVVEILPPDEGRELLKDRFTGRDVAGAGAGLDQRRALPVLADAAVVVQRRFRRHRDLGRGRVGAQPQIDAEHIAVGGAFLQELHQAADDPHMEGGGVVLVGERRRVRVVEYDQIDIARIVELEGAHLAHGEHDVAAALLRLRRIGGLEPATRGGLSQQKAYRGANGGVRKLGHRACHPHHRPHTADIGQCNEQRRFRPHPAQEPHRFGFVLGGGDRLLGFRQQFGQMHIGIGIEQRQQPLGLGGREVPQVWRAIGEAEQQGLELRRGRDQALQRLAGGAAPDLRQPCGDACVRRLAVHQPRRVHERKRQRLFVLFRWLGFLPNGPGHALS